MSEIRQLEQLGFRAWPAARITPLGGWAVQLTPYYPSKRGNSVNFPVSEEVADIAQRVEACEALFAQHGKPSVFRLTPLAPLPLKDDLKMRGYQPVGKSSVMTYDLRNDAFLQIPHQHPNLKLTYFLQGQETEYSQISAELHHRPQTQIAGLAKVLSSIQPQKYLAACFDNGKVSAVMTCVSDNGYTGLFDLCVSENLRRKGFAKALVLNQMEQAKIRGDHHFWLQVETDNVAAHTLYENMGFSTLYDYIYYCK